MRPWRLPDVIIGTSVQNSKCWGIEPKTFAFVYLLDQWTASVLDENSLEFHRESSVAASDSPKLSLKKL